MKKCLLLQFIIFSVVISDLAASAAVKHDIAADPLYQGVVEKRAIRNLNDAITSMQSSPNPDVVAEGFHLQSLAFDLNPTVYIQNGEIKNPSGRKPMCIESDVSSISKLYEDNSQFGQVELLEIRLKEESELETVVDATNFQNLPDLKYLVIHCSFEICSSPGCEASIISQMVKGTEGSDIIILYLTAISE